MAAPQALPVPMEVELPKRRRDDRSAERGLPLFELEPDGSAREVDAAALRPRQLSLRQLRPRDRGNFYFLTLLYFLQGVPVGLAFGSVPFMLKEKLSYAEVGLFSLASYPYSLKLLWSPVVDAFYSTKWGRRRSWIVPIQLFSSAVLLALSFVIAPLMAAAKQNLATITVFFSVLVFGCATQDIAVDGWALTLLSKPALPYASTAQTIGINTGYFTSFTVFLALSSPEFANKYWRSAPGPDGLVTLPGYLFWCGILYLVVTAYVAFGKTEDDDASAAVSEFADIGTDPRDPWGSTAKIYRVMLNILRLPSMKQLVAVHMVAKIAFQAAEAVTNLKLLERGLSKEDLALVVLIDFPFEIVFGYYGAKWSTQVSPLQPWMWAFVGRLVYAAVSMSQVYFYPRGGTTGPFLLYVILVHVAGSFLSTIQFVSITAFHTKVADPEIGGTYMTVLNTISNLGGQWPRVVVLAGVDWFTTATCSAGGASCASEDAKRACKAAGGVCNVTRDGYYVMNIVCILLGIALYTGFIRRTLTELQHLPTSAWRAAKN